MKAALVVTLSSCVVHTCTAFVAPVAGGSFHQHTPTLLQHGISKSACARPTYMSIALEPPNGRSPSSPKEALVLPDCPRSIWDHDGLDEELKALTPRAKDKLPSFPAVLEAKTMTGDLSAVGPEYFRERRGEIIQQLRSHGAVYFKGFELMKDTEGFRAFFEALGLMPCMDPIHTSGLRKMVAKKDAVYETVNKEALAKHYIGLHNESSTKKSSTFGAFVCFKPAAEGGEFTIADGRRILADLDPEVRQRLYEKQVRISVANLDFNFLENFPEPVQDAAKGFLKWVTSVAVAPKFDMDLEMVWGADGQPFRLQAIEPRQSPINRHPLTKEAMWFCNMHNHARYLRDRRPCAVPEVGMTEVYHGDLSRVAISDIQHVNEVSEANIVEVSMQTGDVVLVDNYRTLHGRNIFTAPEGRFHAVTWFGGQEDEVRMNGGDDGQGGDKGNTPGDFLNDLVNRYLVPN